MRFFQVRVLEWGAIAFSGFESEDGTIFLRLCSQVTILNLGLLPVKFIYKIMFHIDW